MRGGAAGGDHDRRSEESPRLPVLASAVDAESVTVRPAQGRAVLRAFHLLGIGRNGRLSAPDGKPAREPDSVAQTFLPQARRHAATAKVPQGQRGIRTPYSARSPRILWTMCTTARPSVLLLVPLSSSSGAPTGTSSQAASSGVASTAEKRRSSRQTFTPWAADMAAKRLFAPSQPGAASAAGTAANETDQGNSSTQRMYWYSTTGPGKLGKPYGSPQASEKPAAA